MTAQKLELPSDGLVTRTVFEALPVPSGRWAWQLRAGRLEMAHVPVTGWQWLTVVAALEHWRRLGHATAGDQYVADSGFMRGGIGGTNLVAGAVAFKLGRSPDGDARMHDAAEVHAVVEAVAAQSDERDVAEKLLAYVRMGIPCCWIIRKQSAGAGEDGFVTMYELADGEYRLTGNRLVSQL